MKFIIANWKAYVTTEKGAKALAAAVQKVKFRKGIAVVLCPPFPFFSLARAHKGRGVSWGAQDMFWKEGGAYTGEVTSEMLSGAGITYVIIGHSERRNYAQETDEMVNAKVRAALAAGLRPIVCVGEREREDPASIPRCVAEQTHKAFAGIEKNKMEEVIIAYEPIWAIGTGTADTSDDALSAALYIRKVIGEMYDAKTAAKIKVLYGGSVDSRNIAEFINQEGIDGVLVGRASIEKKEFAEIMRAI